MCGGGGGDDAAKQANKMEKQRRQQVAAATRAINNIFTYGQGADEAASIQDQIAGLTPDQNGIGSAVPVGTSYTAGPFGTGIVIQGTKGAAANPQTATTIDQLNARLSELQRAALAPYQQYGQDIATNLNTDLNNQSDIAKRNVKFGLARAGLTGGSADIDANAQLTRQYNEGLSQAQQKAAQAYNDLLSKDQQEKQQLISLATSGLSASDAGTQAAIARQADIDNAQAAAKYAALDDVFGGLGTAYTTQKIAQGVQAAQNAYANLPRAYGSTPGSYYPASPAYGSVSGR